MKKKKLALLNLFSVILVIGVNAASQILRFNDTTNGEVSYKYFNLFTPADYAFAIWGVIFLGLIAYSVFQVRRAFFSHKNSDFIEQTGYWFALANFLTTAWVFAFTYEYIGLSVLIMIGILVSLLKVVINKHGTLGCAAKSDRFCVVAYLLLFGLDCRSDHCQYRFLFGENRFCRFSS